MVVTRYEKMAQAFKLLFSCFGKKGVWASPCRYMNTCWTRDFALAIQPLLLEIGEAKTARNHLENLSALQRPNGQIPILFLDDERAWLKMKAEEELKNGKTPFMLRRYREGELWNLTPGTRDSEICYLVAALSFCKAASYWVIDCEYSYSINSAMNYVEKNLMKEGLVIGCDWRDTMEKELGDKPLLTNNCLLYHVYRLMGRNAQAENLRERIADTFLKNGTLIDYPGATRFDPLGASFAVLFNVIDIEKKDWEGLRQSFLEVDTDYGVTIKCRHNPHTPKEAPAIDRTNGEVVWPFVVGFTAMAFNLLDRNSRSLNWSGMAEKQFEKMLKLDGFREWYDPADGQGYGADEQLWSATLFLRTYATLAHIRSF